jgi:hypothetical protein
MFWADAGAADGHMARCQKCEKNTRRTRIEEKADGGALGEPDRNGRLVYYSEEERKRRSDLAKQLHAQGRLGGAAIGAKGGRAVGRLRIFDNVLDHFRQPEKQDLVTKAIESNLKGKSKPARLAAVRELRFIEQMQDERLRADRGGGVDPSEMSQDELMEFVAQGLGAMFERGEISLEDVSMNDVVALSEDAVRDLP